tara:strand:+ start:352 stop:825 length:474 start_codon:yes stop_codon:yes gene_type:complete
MSKNLNTIIIGALTIAFIGYVIINQDKNTFDKPMTLEENIIWIDFKEDQMDLWMTSNVNVYGFQFEFSGVKLLDSDGGVLNREGFDVSHNDRMILSFDYKGNHIPDGEHMLLSLDVKYEPSKENVKMSNMVLAGEGGKSIDFSYYNSIYNSTTFRTN